MILSNRNANMITMAIQNNLYTYLISRTAATGWLLYGIDKGGFSGAKTFYSGHIELASHLEGFVVSNLIIGELISGSINDKWGRRPLLIIFAFLFIPSVTLSAVSQTIYELNEAWFDRRISSRSRFFAVA